MEVSFWTFQMSPVCTTMTAAIKDIMDKNNGRRPIRSIRNPRHVSHALDNRNDRLGKRLTRNERGCKEPRIQEPGHQCRKVFIKVQALLKQGTRVVNQCVDASKLLEGLHTASNQEALPRLDVIFLEQIAPGSGTDRCLVRDRVHNIVMDSHNRLVAHLLPIEPPQDFERFVRPAVRDQPAGCLREDHDD